MKTQNMILEGLHQQKIDEGVTPYFTPKVISELMIKELQKKWGFKNMALEPRITTMDPNGTKRFCISVVGDISAEDYKKYRLKGSYAMSKFIDKIYPNMFSDNNVKSWGVESMEISQNTDPIKASVDFRGMYK